MGAYKTPQFFFPRYIQTGYKNLLNNCKLHGKHTQIKNLEEFFQIFQVTVNSTKLFFIGTSYISKHHMQPNSVT